MFTVGFTIAEVIINYIYGIYTFGQCKAIKLKVQQGITVIIVVTCPFGQAFIKTRLPG